MKKFNIKNLVWIGFGVVAAIVIAAVCVIIAPKKVTVNEDVTGIVAVDNSLVLIDEIDNSPVILDEVPEEPTVAVEVVLPDEEVVHYRDSELPAGTHVEITKEGTALIIENKTEESAPAPVEQKMFVTLSISCHGIKDCSTEELWNCIPNEGYLLTSCQVEIKQGDTVRDVLLRVIESKGIPCTYSDSSAFGTYFSMIDNLSDSKIGHTAGWCYYVNGSMPSVSSGALQVNDGDVISWEYDDDWNLDMF